MVCGVIESGGGLFVEGKSGRGGVATPYQRNGRADRLRSADLSARRGGGLARGMGRT